MRFSGSFKSSPYCTPSPDGRFIATLFPSSSVTIRAVKSLATTNVIELPRDLAGPVFSFKWSPSSQNILVAVADQIHVFSARDASFRAVIRYPVPPSAQPAYIGFGPDDREVCVCSSLGLKFAVFDLASSKAVEIANPKFHSSATACRGFSFRPATAHLAILTRTAGKDVVSVHDPTTREVQRSWNPNTLDAQGLAWTRDGKWLLVWESAGQGHKLLFYTPDGHVFKVWTGPDDPSPKAIDRSLGAGIKVVQQSADGMHVAVGDSSRWVCLLGMASLSESMRLRHPGSIVPQDTLRVWQEQTDMLPSGAIGHSFIQATQTIYPPARPSTSSSDARSGCSAMSFDASSTLLATRLEEYPSTVWIWDIQAPELRAALVFHSNVTKAAWNPQSRETLLILCEGDQHTGIAFVWDPLAEGPKVFDFSRELSAGSKPGGKTQTTWLNLDTTAPPTVVFSDGKEYLLASLLENEQDSPPWAEPPNGEWNSALKRDESPLELVLAGATGPGHLDDEDDNSELEDTFHYKREA